MTTYPSYHMRNNNTQQHTDQFMEFYEKYSDDIFRFCMVKTRDRSLSLDITQDTFMRFWEYIIKDTEIKNERPLLYRIAKNLIIDFYRKKKELLVEDYSDSSFQEQLSHDDRERLENIIDGQKAIEFLHQLPESTREIVTLRFLHDFSISEIASMTKKDNKTVSVYLHRGLKSLRTILKNYE